MPSQTFNASGTWTCPAGVSSATVECWGGGGGPSDGGGQGGGGGSYARSIVSVTPGNNYNVVVGAGGGLAQNGGNTTWETSVVIAIGGGTPTGGSGGTGQVTFNGGNGFNGGSFAGGGGSAFTNANGNNGTDGLGGTGTGNGGDYGQPGQAPGGGSGYEGSGGATGRLIVTWTSPAGVGGDPHFVGFDNKKFDFHGQVGNSYCLYEDEYVTVNAKFIDVIHPIRKSKRKETFIGEVYILVNKEEVKITNCEKELTLFNEHAAIEKYKVKLTRTKMLTLFGEITYDHKLVQEDITKYLPRTMDFPHGTVADKDAYVVPTPHGSIIVVRMAYDYIKFLNVAFNVTSQNATGIVGQTVRTKRQHPESFKVDHPFQTQRKILI